MAQIVSGKRGWVTRVSTEYAWWGDRSFILGDRSSEKTKGDRSLCVMCDRPPCNHHIVIVEMDKIVSAKGVWVSLS
ncbi:MULTISPECIES: hypothetical protein [unclassified Microcoleus]|uniref:hypothetical protein n=1 Tax=unclassified Microcoleus TaxID=2642155 RepID=UPI002FD5AB22